MRQMFRVVISFTDKVFKNTRPSNIFLWADSSEQAIAACTDIFKTQLVQTGIPTANFKVDIFVSSEEEAKQYQINKNKTVN